MSSPAPRPARTSWQEAFAAGQARHAALTWDVGAFERRARAALTRRLAPLGIEPSEDALADLLDQSAAEDLWLASAVESCVQGAEACLRAELGPKLEALALRRGLVPARARAETVRTLTTVLSSPGARGADRLGGYDGSADLEVWLASLLEESEQQRAHEPAPGEAPKSPPEPARPHPSALFLAAAAQGRLLPQEVQALLKHLPTCARCGAHLKGLELAGVQPAAVPQPAGQPARVPRSTLGSASAAKPRRAGGVLLGIATVCGVIALALNAGGGRALLSGLGRGGDTQRAVFEAAEDLARREPGFFGDFVPYDRQELESAPTRPVAPDGQGVDLLHPLDDVLNERPTLLWRPLEDTTHYLVTLRSTEGESLFERRVEGHRLAFPEGQPPLVRDERYVWRVQAEGPDVVAAEAAFRVASERQQQHWERRRARVVEHVSNEAVRAVLLAQVALRRGHPWEAWLAIRAHERRVPSDAYGAALAGYLRKMHGYLD